MHVISPQSAMLLPCNTELGLHATQKIILYHSSPLEGFKIVNISLCTFNNLIFREVQIKIASYMMVLR